MKFSLDLTEDSLRLDNTQKETASACLRKYFLNYLLSLKSDIGSTALRYGSTWHAAQEAFYGHIKENGWEHGGGAITAAITTADKKWKEETEKRFIWYDDYRTLANLCTAFMQYIDHFVGDEGHLEVISTEKPFKLPIILTQEEKKLFPYAKPFWFTGITDLEIYYDMRYWQLDHKTTGQALSIQSGRLQRSAQSIGYTYAGREIFEELPEGHFIALAHLSAYKSKKTGEYGKPKIDFQRIPMLYSEEDVYSWRLGFIQRAQEIQIAVENDSFPCEHGSCYTYGRCTYTDICDRNLNENEIRKVVDNQGFEGYHIGEKWDPAKNL